MEGLKVRIDSMLSFFEFMFGTRIDISACNFVIQIQVALLRQNIVTITIPNR